MVVLDLGVRGNIQNDVAKDESEADFGQLGLERRHCIARGHYAEVSADDSAKNRPQDTSGDLRDPVGPEIRQRHRSTDECGKRNRGVIMSAADGTPGENQRDEYNADGDRCEFGGRALDGENK